MDRRRLLPHLWVLLLAFAACPKTATTDLLPELEVGASVDPVPQAPASDAVNVFALDAHTAARFFARTLGRIVIVSGGSAEPLTFSMKATDRTQCVRELARRSGLTFHRVGKTIILAPADVIEHLAGRERPTLEGGDPIDAELHHAAANDVLAAAAGVAGVEIRGRLDGELTLAGRSIDPRELIAVLLGLSQATANIVETSIEIIASRPLPTVSDPPHMAPCSPPAATGARLACVPIADLSVAATAVIDGRWAALVRSRDSAFAEVVLVGDRIGSTASQVTQIAAESVQVGDGALSVILGP